MASSSSARGLLIGSKNGRDVLVVGKELGNGACGSVHELVVSEEVSSKWCVKVVLMGDPASRSKKQKDQVHLSNMLHYEHVLYAVHLAELRGIYIPELPQQLSSSAYGEVGGYRFLVMERMGAQFMEGCLKELRKGSIRASATIADVATTLLDICEAVHAKGYLIVDIKPENFMLARGTGPLVGRIRMIDFGLMQTFGSVSGHRTNDGSKGVVGTPLYASLHMHDLSTPARRDDLESIGYILCELMLKLQQGDVAELPWASGGSDSAIGALKRAIVDDPKNRFWQTIPVVQEYFEEVRGLGFKQIPEYDRLRCILSRLRVKVKAKKESRSSASTPCRRTTRPSAKRLSPGEEEQPSKFSRVGETMDVDDVSDSDRDAEMMDWESDHEEDADTKPKAVPVGLTLRCVGGENEGEHFVLIRGEKDSVTVGKDGDVSLADANVDRVHAQLTLQSTKELLKLSVKDLKSSTGTFLNSTKIPNGRNRMAFINDEISIGNTVWKVSRLKPEDVTRYSYPGPNVLEVDDDDEDENQPPRAAQSRGKGAMKTTKIGVVLQPASRNKGRVTLALGETESAVIGNAKFSLVARKGFCSVFVTPKGSSSKVLLNSKPFVSKKGTMCFLGDQVDVDGKGSVYKLQKL